MVAVVKGEVDQTHYDARGGGKPKHPQTSFAIKDGMKDQNAPSGVTSAIAPIHPGVGPDASMADVLDPQTPAERGRTLRRQPGGVSAKTNNGDWVPGKLNSAWGMKGGDGQGVDPDIGGKVLGEAILSGSSKLPDTVTPAKGSASAYTGKDPN
jgi:hypothetical protein